MYVTLLVLPIMMDPNDVSHILPFPLSNITVHIFRFSKLVFRGEGRIQTLLLFIYESQMDNPSASLGLGVLGAVRYTSTVK